MSGELAVKKRLAACLPTRADRFSRPVDRVQRGSMFTLGPRPTTWKNSDLVTALVTTTLETCSDAGRRSARAHRDTPSSRALEVCAVLAVRLTLENLKQELRLLAFLPLSLPVARATYTSRTRYACIVRCGRQRFPLALLGLASSSR